MGTVPHVVDHWAVAGEIALGRNLAGKVRMGVVDAGVEDSDRYPLAGVAGLPGGRGADLRHADVQRRPAPAIQPHLADVGAHRLDTGPVGGQAGPERAGLTPRHIIGRGRSSPRVRSYGRL